MHWYTTDYKTLQALAAAEMVQYITRCGQEGYPAATELYMDHHFLVTFLKAMSKGEQIDYVVLSSMCAGNCQLPDCFVQLNKHFNLPTNRQRMSIRIF